MSGHGSRVLRKARRVETTELDRKFNTELGALKRARDEKLQTAGQAFRDGVEKLREEQAKTRGDAYHAYEADRAALLKRLAKEAS